MRRTLLCLLAIPVFAGCASVETPRLRPAAPEVSLARSDAAVVVFARSLANTWTSAVVVDERGRFLGDSVANSRWAVALAPGEHVFVAWDTFGEDSPDEDWYEAYYGPRNRRVGRVGVLRATLTAGKVYYVEVTNSHVKGWVRGNHTTGVDLLPIALQKGAPPPWVAETRFFDVDRERGQGEIDRRLDIVRHRISAAFDRLGRFDDPERVRHTLQPSDGGCCSGTSPVSLAAR